MDGFNIVKTFKSLPLSKSSGAYQEEIVGAAVKSSSFQLFSLPTDIATSNFFSYILFDEDSYIPYEIQVGELLPDILEKHKSKGQTTLKEMFNNDTLKLQLG